MNIISDNEAEQIAEKLRRVVVDVPDYPKKGIIFKDITPVFASPQLCNDMVNYLRLHFAGRGIDAVIGLESRGFLLGMPLALALNVPFVMIRKKGKLPRETLQVDYDLEYGQASIEMHRDAIKPGQNILIHDDVLATGGTATAAANLVEQAGACVAGFSFILELSFLNGRKSIEKYSHHISTFAAY